MDIWVLCGVLLTAAVLGDNVNYWIGHHIGPKVFRWDNSRFFNRSAFDKTHSYFESHGGKTIIIARFLPLLRTFAPFVAGVARMTYMPLRGLDFLGASSGSSRSPGWATVSATCRWSRRTSPSVILAIIAISLLPVFFGWLKSRGGRWRVEEGDEKKIVILISGRGSNMEAIVRAQIPGAEVAAVIANRPDAAGLAFAVDHGIVTQVVDHKAYPSREAFDAALADAIDAHRPDLWWCWPASCACSPTPSSPAITPAACSTSTPACCRPSRASTPTARPSRPVCGCMGPRSISSRRPSTAGRW